MPTAPTGQKIDWNALNLQVAQQPSVLQSPQGVQPLTPDELKARIVIKYPMAKASDGRLYANIPAQELVTKIVQKYPDGVTNDGHKYSDFLLSKPVAEKPQLTTAGIDIAPLNVEKARIQAANALDMTKPIAPTFQIDTSGGANTVVPNIARYLGNLPSDVAEVVRSATQSIPALGDAIGALLHTAITNPDAIKKGAENVAQGFAAGVDSAIANPKEATINAGIGITKTILEHPTLVPSLLVGGEAAKGKDLIQNIARPVINTANKVVPAVEAAATAKRVEQLTKLFNPSKTLSATELKYGKDSPAFAAQLEREGIELKFGADARGRLDTTAAQDAVSAVAKRDNQTMNRLLESSGTTVNLDDAAEVARKAAKAEYKGTDQAKALAHIDEELAAYKQQYASQGIVDVQGNLKLPTQVANEIKQDLWSKSKFPALGSPTDQLNAGTKYIFGHAFKDAIETAAGSAEVKLLNQRLGNLASLSKMLQKAQGGAISGSWTTKITGRVMGAVAGAAAGGGPIGVFTGTLTGDLIAQALNSPNRLSWAKAILARAETEMPDILRQVEARIGKNAKEILDRKLLPPGRAPGTPENPIQMGRGPDTSGVKLIPAGESPATTKPLQTPKASESLPASIPQEAQKAIDNHLTSAEQILKEMPNSKLSEVLERTKTNIADGLEAQGFKSLAEKVRQFDLSPFTDFQAFKNAILEYVKTVQPGLSMKAVNPFDQFNSAQQAFLARAGQSLKNGKYLKVSEWEMLKKLLESKGYKVPSTQKKTGEMLYDMFRSTKQRREILGEQNFMQQLDQSRDALGRFK